MSRPNRIDQLKRICLKNNLTPASPGFADKIIQICASLYGVNRGTARTYVTTLIDAWKFNKWQDTVVTCQKTLLES